MPASSCVAQTTGSGSMTGCAATLHCHIRSQQRTENRNDQREPDMPAACELDPAQGIRDELRRPGLRAFAVCDQQPFGCPAEQGFARRPGIGAAQEARPPLTWRAALCYRPGHQRASTYLASLSSIPPDDAESDHKRSPCATPDGRTQPPPSQTSRRTGPDRFPATRADRIRPISSASNRISRLASGKPRWRVQHRLRPLSLPLCEEQMMNLVRRDDVTHRVEALHRVDEFLRQFDRRPHPGAAVGQAHNGHTGGIGKAVERDRRSLRNVQRWSEFFEHRVSLPRSSGIAMRTITYTSGSLP